MQSLRLLVVATAMLAMLALVAGFAATDDRLRRGQTGTEAVVVPPPVSAAPVEARVPRKAPIVAKEGETVELTVTLTEPDTVVLDAFGLEESIAADIATPVLFTALAPGRYDLKLQDSGRRIGQLVVEPAESAPTPAPRPRTAPHVPTVPDASPDIARARGRDAARV